MSANKCLLGKIILGGLLGYITACLNTGFAKSLSNDIGMTSEKILYDFTTISSLENWHESSDTVRTPGMSKGAFVIQKSRLFQRAVFFSMLNPQPNGAGFVGFYTYDDWNLENFTALEIRARGQGQNSVYKFMFKHKGHTIDDGSVSYQSFFEVPNGEWTTVVSPFTSFKPYFRGRIQPDAEPLDLQRVSLVGLQIVGGVYSDFKQFGTSSLEIDYIKAIK